MDKNQGIGLVLIFVLFVGYMYFFTPDQEELQKQTTTEEVNKQDDSEQASNEGINEVNSEATNTEGDSIKTDTPAPAVPKGPFISADATKDIILENDELKLTLSSKGGIIKRAELKEFKSIDSTNVVLINEYSNKLNIEVPTIKGDYNLADFNFETKDGNKYVKKASDILSVTFKLPVDEKSYIEQTYRLGGTGYQIGYEIKFKNLDQFVKDKNIAFKWNVDQRLFENDMEQSRSEATINYYTKEDGFDYLSERSTDLEQEAIVQPLTWIAMKQRFFTAAIIADKQSNIAKAEVKSEVPVGNDTIVKNLEAKFEIAAQDIKAAKGSYRFYMGPNRFQKLKAVTEGFEENVDLGWAVFGWINRFLVIPVFAFLEGFIGNYGIIIIILVLVVKTLLFPLAYKSYLSMAKMRELKPELDELTEKYGDDMQKKQQEQMKLYGQVGINPLSGCIPVLLQMPVLLALFNFFPNAIELRHESFLWAHDLSTYDAPFHLPFSIPFYGDHVSLFTLLMTVSTLAYTWYNNQINTTAQGPMKSIGYFMPVIFMFVLNSFPAGLTFYYFVSNIITIGQQRLATQFIDRDKIRKALEENKLKNKDKKKSKFQQRLEDAMKAREQAKKKKK